MTSKRIRIDVQDKDGAKYDFKIEGNVTRDKVLKIFELMDLINIEESGDATKPGSVGGKIWHIVDKYYPTGRFSSSEILERYEDEYNDQDLHLKTKWKEPRKAENGLIRLQEYQT